MYQVELSAQCGERINANLNEADCLFLSEKWQPYISIAVYDNKITKTEVNGEKFHSRNNAVKWLGKWIADYEKKLSWFKKQQKIEDCCIDILYDEFFTGNNTANVWQRIKFNVYELCEHYDYTPTTKKDLRRFIKRALCSFAISH